MSNWPRPQRILGALIADVTDFPIVGRRLLDNPDRVIILRKSGYHRDEINEISQVGVEVYSPDLDECEDVADIIYSMLIDARSAESDEGIMDRARCEVAPQEVPVKDSDVLFCVGAIYRVSTRRQD